MQFEEKQNVIISNKKSLHNLFLSIQWLYITFTDITLLLALVFMWLGRVYNYTSLSHYIVTCEGYLFTAWKNRGDKSNLLKKKCREYRDVLTDEYCTERQLYNYFHNSRRRFTQWMCKRKAKSGASAGLYTITYTMFNNVHLMNLAFMLCTAVYWLQEQIHINNRQFFAYIAITSQFKTQAINKILKKHTFIWWNTCHNKYVLFFFLTASMDMSDLTEVDKHNFETQMQFGKDVTHRYRPTKSRTVRIYLLSCYKRKYIT